MRPISILSSALPSAAWAALVPLAVNTWGGAFTVATDEAYARLTSGSSALDAAQAGCAACERNRCDGTVGYGGSPDESCETTLDAMLMDGTTLNTGSVASLRRIRDAVAVARLVLDHTDHTMLAGDQATAFAVQNGFVQENLTTAESAAQCADWKVRDRCQPNYRVDVVPDSHSSPQASHDTISQITIDLGGSMAAGTTTNGASHKVPGRVGDGPIPGSGSYVDGEVGGCGATGDGDVMMRFLPCYQAVENLRRGMDPTESARDVVARMLRRYPDLASGVVVVDSRGRHGGAASGWTFTYAFRGGDMNATEVVTIEPLS
ncbi:N4-(beta-N-acetylglucosaminyl)-L-asparaginase [Geosmithia morbida]|uniref:N4-(Beta-N-acetylglucosaminyl)-L-asparaginase n=1 Tax=Geosmithia morbida TaxID=1094350 RepID=A0A9P4YT47_9HYPO|nr:N4-(beta-N-acetylglucosaminyl)-L-asparaginase [Geosmithia morbida]KAF4122052.1 N4-(beta-N-acetylglucosaminyl)-L-asparaginase [Geosmithia morbida]